MHFGLSSDQRLLQEGIDRYLNSACSLDLVRGVATGDRAQAAALQKGVAELGTSAVLVPAKYGGLGLGLLEAALVAESLGRRVAPVAFVASSVMAPLALVLGGSEAQRQAWLPRLATGEAQAAVAVSGGWGRRDRAGVAARDDQLDGTAIFALDSGEPDLIVVGDDVGRLHLVDARSDRVQRLPLTTIDHTRAVAEFRFIEAPSEPLPEGGLEATRRVIDAGRVILAADILGAAGEMLRQAVVYAGQREQFGRLIGSFQAVKHMCAEMAAQLEPCRSLVWYAGHAFDHAPEEAALAACHAKSHLSEVGQFVARTSTEVHGGYGFTDLAGLHFWFKRIGFDRQMLGGPEAVRNEAARLQGWIAASAW